MHDLRDYDYVQVLFFLSSLHDQPHFAKLIKKIASMVDHEVMKGRKVPRRNQKSHEDHAFCHPIDLLSYFSFPPFIVLHLLHQFFLIFLGSHLSYLHLMPL